MDHIKGINDHLKPCLFPFSLFSLSVCSSIHQKSTFTGILWQLVKGSWTQPPVLLCFHSFFGSVMSPKHQRLDSYFSTFLSLGLDFSPSLSLNPFLKFHNNVSLFIPSLFNIRKNKNCQTNLSFSPSFCFSLSPP